MKHFKIIFIVTILFTMTGCLSNMSPSEKAEELMDRYIKNDDSIIEELDEYMEQQNLNEEEKTRYKNIIMDEYATIQYQIKDEEINGDDATVTIDIEVKNLYKASILASTYFQEHKEEFYQDNLYDESKFIDYKLSLMENMTETINYVIYIELKEIDGIWTILEMDNNTLEKIHGIYNYIED